MTDKEESLVPGELIEKLPLDEISSIHRKALEEIEASQPEDGVSRYRHNLAIRQEADQKALHAIKSWIVDLIAPSMVKVREDIAENDFSSSNPKHLNALLLASIMTTNKQPELVKTIRTVAEIGGVFQTKQDEGDITAEALGVLWKKMITQNRLAPHEGQAD